MRYLGLATMEPDAMLAALEAMPDLAEHDAGHRAEIEARKRARGAR